MNEPQPPKTHLIREAEGEPVREHEICYAADGLDGHVDKLVDTMGTTCSRAKEHGYVTEKELRMIQTLLSELVKPKMSDTVKRILVAMSIVIVILIWWIAVDAT